MGILTSRSISRVRAATATPSFFATLAISALVSTILLIMVGSIVRVTGNGLGCPDWPLCHGRAIPPMMTSAWIEFLHRLFGATVVLQIAALILLTWRNHRQEKWLRRTAIFASVVLSTQVVLGGIHVIYELPRWTGWIHTAIAMLVAGSSAVWVGLTQTDLRRIGDRTAENVLGTRLLFWTTCGAIATYLLLLTGSLVTRTGAALVCPNFPSCGLAFVPDNLRTIVFIQMTHRYTAYSVALLVTLLLWHLLKAARRDVGLQRFAIALAILLTMQFTLGIVNVLDALPMWSRILHLGTAGTIWVVMVLLWTTLMRGRQRANAKADAK
jgi:heme A synthase